MQLDVELSSTCRDCVLDESIDRAAQLLLKDDDVISFDVQYERQQLSATNKTGGRAVHTSRLCLEGGSFPEDALQLGADVQAGASVIYR